MLFSDLALKICLRFGGLKRGEHYGRCCHKTNFFSAVGIFTKRSLFFAAYMLPRSPSNFPSPPQEPSKSSDSNDEFSDVEWDEELEKAVREAEKVNLVDIEDLDRVAEQLNTPQELPNHAARHPKTYLSVTDISSLVWCEYQSHLFRVTNRTRKQSEAMKVGTEIHEKLELELHDIVSIKITTLEDRWGQKFLNSFILLHELSAKGMTREIPVFGVYRHPNTGKLTFLYGIIDEIRRNSIGNYEISDTKTRASIYNPSEPIKRPSIMQLSLYKKLWDDLVLGLVNIVELIACVQVAAPQLKLHEPFSQDFHSESGLPSQVNSVHSLLSHTLHSFTSFPRLEKTLELNYVSQKTRQFMMSVTVEYDQVVTDQFLERAMLYFAGDREPMGVDLNEAFKCRDCEVAEICDWRQRKALEFSNVGASLAPNINDR